MNEQTPKNRVKIKLLTKAAETKMINSEVIAKNFRRERRFWQHNTTHFIMLLLARGCYAENQQRQTFT